MAGRQSVRENKSHESGTLGLYLSKYDCYTKTWTAIGGIDGDSYSLEQDGDEFYPSLLWEPHGYYRDNGDSLWYQNYANKIKFDKNNRMHITANVNADTIQDNSSHIIYAYSDNGGQTFQRLDGSVISSLPMRITDTKSNRPDIVLTQTKSNPIFDSVTPALFWDKDGSPAISYKDISTSKTTTYRYYNKDTTSWKSKEFDIKVEGIRSDHYSLNDGTMLIVGNSYQVQNINSFSDKGIICELEKSVKQSISNDHLVREVDEKLLLDKNLIRGHSEIDGKSVVITFSLS